MKEKKRKKAYNHTRKPHNSVMIVTLIYMANVSTRQHKKFETMRLKTSETTIDDWRRVNFTACMDLRHVDANILSNYLTVRVSHAIKLRIIVTTV